MLLPHLCCGGRRWTRLLLLQQLLVELIDLLDPDCVRLPLGRRVRLMPVSWASPPGLSEYQGRLQVGSLTWLVLFPLGGT